jgi:predicted ester cyclase
LADAPGWKDYDMTTSYEAYIVTHTNKVAAKAGKFIGTVTTPGDPVPYDCYVTTAEWRTPSFIQLYAFRKENTWSGPVNVQAILKFWEEKSGTSLKMNTWYMSTGHDHRARNLRHCRRIPVGKHPNSGSKYASPPAKTNTQADPTSTALKGEYFGNANLSTLVKTQTNPSAGAESIRNAFGGGGFIVIFS